jgi:hypothetical protein
MDASQIETTSVTMIGSATDRNCRAGGDIDLSVADLPCCEAMESCLTQDEPEGGPDSNAE